MVGIVLMTSAYSRYAFLTREEKGLREIEMKTAQKVYRLPSGELFGTPFHGWRCDMLGNSQRDE